MPVRPQLLAVLSGGGAAAWRGARNGHGSEAAGALPSVGAVADTTRCRKRPIPANKAMDRKAWIAIILSIIGLAAWQWSCVKTYSRKVPVPPQEEAASAAPAPSATPVATPAPAQQEPVVVAQNQSLYSPSAEYVFSNDTGGIERAILLLHFGENKQAVFLNGSRTMPIGAVGEGSGEAWGGFTMQTNAGKGEAIFTPKDPDGLEITKRFSPATERKRGWTVCRPHGSLVPEHRQVRTWSAKAIS